MKIRSPRSEIDWSDVENDATQLLSHYIRFDTTNPPGYEAEAIAFLADTLRERGFEPRIVEAAPGRTSLVVRLPARTEPGCPPCLLYAHADVVPANPADWSIPPFQGEIKDGFVWGRGALDSKGLGIIFLQALTLLKEYGPPLNRDIILLIAADEEVCGRYGVAWLLDHHPQLIKAEYVWDEGGVGFLQPGATSRYLYQIAVAEKATLTVKLTAHGTPGHASIPQPDNAQDRLVRALSRVNGWNQPARLTEPVIEMLKALAGDQSFPRAFLFGQADRSMWWPILRHFLENDLLFSPLIRNTVSLTMLRGGQASNVIPAQAEAKLDIRLLPDENPELVLAVLRSIIADPKVAVEIEEYPVAHVPTPADTEFFDAMARTLRMIGPPGAAIPYVSPGTTDSRFFRQVGMKAYGFVPMLLDVQELSRIHGADERVSTANLRWGTHMVFETLQKFAGVSDSDHRVKVS